MVMVYLCRHGIAEDARKGMSDAERALTAEGVKKFRKAADGLVKLVGPGGISHVVSSPLLRARQTAEILAEAVAAKERKIEVQLSKTLGSPGDLRGLMHLVRGLRGAEGIVAVGHEPLLSQWAAELCFDRHGRLRLKKGAVAAIELADAGQKGELVWLLQPGMLRDV